MKVGIFDLIAILIQVGIVIAPFLVTEIRHIGHSYGRCDDVPDGSQRTLLETKHAVKPGAERGAQAEIEGVVKSGDRIHAGVAYYGVVSGNQCVVRPAYPACLAVHPVGDVDRCAQRKVFQHFHGQ